METRPQLDSNIESINKSVDFALKDVDQSPFSPQAFVTLKGRISEYISDLIEESHKASKRDSSDSISAKHIDFAATRMKQFDRGIVNKHLGTVGGVFLGTSLSNLYPIITTSQLTLSGVLFTLITGMIGGILLTVSVFNE